MTGSSGAPGQQPEQTLENQIQGQATLIMSQLTSGQFAFEDPAEAAHKRQLALDDAAHERKKELDEIRQQAIGQALALALVILVALGCLWVIISNKYPDTTVEKAAGALLLILGGFIGYITGQATKK